MSRMFLLLVATLFLLCLRLALPACAEDPIKDAINSSAGGMDLQSQRLKVIAENIANANIAAEDSKRNPYKRKILQVSEKNGYKKIYIKRDHTPFTLKYEPNHPAADSRGMVKYSNVDLVMEIADAKEVERSLEANLHAMEISKHIQKILIEAIK